MSFSGVHGYQTSYSEIAWGDVDRTERFVDLSFPAGEISWHLADTHYSDVIRGWELVRCIGVTPYDLIL